MEQEQQVPVQNGVYEATKAIAEAKEAKESK